MSNKTLVVSTYLAGLVLVSACMDPTPPPTADDDGGAKAPATRSVDKIVAGCNGCHAGDLSLADWSAEELDARIVELSKDRGGHPVGVPALSDDQRAAVVAALTGN